MGTVAEKNYNFAIKQIGFADAGLFGSLSNQVKQKYTVLAAKYKQEMETGKMVSLVPFLGGKTLNEYLGIHSPVVNSEQELVKETIDVNTKTNNVVEVKKVDSAYSKNQVPAGYSSLLSDAESISFPADVKKYGMIAGGLVVAALVINLVRGK